LSDRIKAQNWRARPELLRQLEKKLANLEKWLDEAERIPLPIPEVERFARQKDEGD
jgi:hypothetical protein